LTGNGSIPAAHYAPLGYTTATQEEEMDYTSILYDVQDQVARVTLNRPQYRNAQSRRLLEEMDDAFMRANRDRDVRVVVLRGEGDHFSAGHDLGTPESVADRQERPDEPGARGRFRRGWDLYIDMSLRWRDIEKPTIAAVQGYCIFGGWMIAAAMDLVFAADDALFLPTNFQYFSVPWDLSVRKAKEIIFEGRFLTAHQALEHGFVNRVYPRDQLDAKTMAYARRVAQNDPFQLRMAKLACNQAQDAQGFTEAIKGAFALYTLSSIGESDPTNSVPAREGRRRPMVQRALDNMREDD
jgi:enoyl-CoA hydratase